MRRNISKLKIDRITFLISVFISLFASFVIFFSHYGNKIHRLPYHDALFLQFPYKFFISSAIQAGTFPLWDQWTNDGASLSSTLSLLHISPVVFIFSLLGTYTYTTVLVEMLFFQFLGFLGMYLWIRQFSNKWISLYIAFIFSSTPALLGTIGEPGVLVSMNFIPLFSYSLKKTVEGSISYAGILSIVLWIMFTSGYFGLNMMYIPIISIYTLILYKFSGKELKKIKNGLLLSCLAGILFLGITNFSWIESYVHTGFDYSSSRTYDFNPFDGAAGIKTLFTLFFTHSFPSFIQETAIVSAPGVTNMIYFGAINILLAVFSFFDSKNKKYFFLLSTLMGVIFLLSLHSYNSFIERAITSIPFLSITRWHGWYNALFIFYGLNLSTLGINYLLKTNYKNSIFKIIISEISLLLIVTFSALLIYFLSDLRSIGFSTLQIFLFALILGSTIVFYKSKIGYGKKFNIVFTTVILAFSIIEFVPSTINALTYRDRWDPTYLDQKIAREFNDKKNDQFPAIENVRKETVNQHITKIPTFDSYNPYTDRRILKLKNNFGETRYVQLSKHIFYFSDDNLNPQIDSLSDIKITKFFPNEIILKVKSENKQNLTWSSPFSPNWKISINGIESKISESPYGFSEFEVNSGINTIRLFYHPDYIKFSFFVMFLSIAVSITLVLFPVFKNRRL